MLRAPVRALVLTLLVGLFFAWSTVTSPIPISHADPTASGADIRYPLNHTFDGDQYTVDAGLTNTGFEADSTSVATPDNSDFEAAEQSVGTPPNNYDFASGNFNNWTTSGTVSIQSNSTQGYYGQMGSSGTLTTASFTVDSSAQEFAFVGGFLNAYSTNQISIYALSGSGFGTQTFIKSYSCNFCGSTWWWLPVDATSYQGQTVKLKFVRNSGTVAVDDVRMSILFPDITVAGTIQRWQDGSDDYARLDNGAYVKTSAITIPDSADFLRVDIKGGHYAGLAKASIAILTGTDFGTTNWVVVQQYMPYNWSTQWISLENYKGQTVKILVQENQYGIGVDDIMLWDEVPGWDTSGSVSHVNDTNDYVINRGSLTTPAITLPTDAQQVSFRWKTNGAVVSQFYVEVLSSTNFGTTTQLVYEDGYNQGWEAFKVGLNSFGGQTVKIRFHQWYGVALLDDVAIENTIPGWMVKSSGLIAGAVAGTDTYGTYVAPSESDGPMKLYSSHLSLGLIDRANVVDMSYYTFDYAIGYQSSSLLQVYWHGDNGQTTELFQDGASSPVKRTGRITIYDFLGDGYLEIYGDGIRVYSLADNVAGAQLGEPFSQKVGLEVDTSTGSFGYQDIDLKTNGRVPLVLERYYKAHSDQYGELGYRWTHSFDTRLTFVDGTTKVSVLFGSGNQEFFGTNGGYYAADPRVTDSLTHNGNGTYTLTTKTGTHYEFDSSGKLTSIVDTNSNAITLTYTSGHLSSVTDPDGRALSLSYDGNGRLQTVTGPDSAVVAYSYDSNGDLTQVTDPEDGVRTYSYDKHRLTEADDQEGNPIFTNTFDSVNRVTQQTDAQNHTIAISYNTPAKGVTTVTDANGHAAKLYFDQFGRTTDKVDPQDNIISYIFDGNGNLQNIVDPHFNQWDFGFNSSGDLTSTEDPLGNPVSIAYNAQHLPTTVTDARGHTTYMSYDTHGNLTSVADPLRSTLGTSEANVSGCGTVGTGDGIDNDSDGKTDDGCPSTLYTYDSAGKMTSMTDALGLMETYGYDSSGDRTSKVDGNGKTWFWTYDAAGRVTSETNPLNQTTEYEYDLFGRPILERNALGQETTYLYDLAGHLLMIEDAVGHDTFWDYDDRGLVDEKIDADGNHTLYTYDGNRNMTSVTEPTRLPHSAAETGTSGCGTSGTGDGQDDDSDGYIDDGCPSTLYTYDENNRLATATDANGGTITYAYDEAGQLVSEEDPIGRTTSYAYNDAGHLTQKTLPNQGVWSYTNDENGNLLTETDALDHTTSYTYDALNRRITTTDPLLNGTTYTYDPVGQLVSVLDAELNTTSYGYDSAGRMASITDPLNHTQMFAYDDAGRRTSVTDALSRMTTYDYDEAGRLTSVSAPGSYTTNYDYDAAGRMTSVTSPNGGVTSYSYDNMGLLLSLKNPLRQPHSTLESGTSGCGSSGTGNGADNDSDGYVDDGCPSTIYAYNANGNRTSMTDANGRATTFGYDPAGRMTSTTDALSHSVLFGYDLAGQQTSVTNANGNTTEYTYGDLGNVATKTDPLNRTQQWTYDDAGNLAETTDARSVVVDYTYDANNQLTDVTYPTGSASYQYDDIGRRTQVADATGTTYWNYDAASRVTSVAAPNGTVAYTYNNANDRATMTLPGSRTFTYAYNSTSGRLTSATDWQSRAIGFSYDSDGNRTGISRPNGVDSTYTYDLADRLMAIDHADSGGTIQSFDYSLDAAGNRTAVVSNAGTESYTLDSLNRVTGVDYPSGDDVSYTYDDNGNIATMTVGTATTTYTYDSADQTTSDGTHTFSYDDNGNLTGNGTDSYSYDYANRLTSATVGSTTTGFAYDGDGVRASKTGGSTTTGYNYDRESGLPLLVDDGTNAYLQQDGPLAQVDGSGDPSYLLGDAVGSVRGVTDNTGALTGTADYNAFGSVRASSGASSALGFTGEQSDPETGLTYMWARYLNPAVVRFISADTVQPNAPGTQGYNPYAYVANNPTTWTDPSGREASASAQAALTLIGVYPDMMRVLLTACIGTAVGVAAAAAVTTLGTAVASPGLGLAVGVCGIAIFVGIAVPALICALDGTCAQAAFHAADLVRRFGSIAASSTEWTLERLKELEETRMKCLKRFEQCLTENWETHEQLCVDCFVYCNAQAEWPSWKCHPEGEENHDKMIPLISMSPAPDPLASIDSPFWLGPQNCAK